MITNDVSIATYNWKTGEINLNDYKLSPFFKTHSILVSKEQTIVLSIIKFQISKQKTEINSSIVAAAMNNLILIVVVIGNIQHK